MLADAVDQRRHRHAADHVDAAADQREAFVGEIDHARASGMRPLNHGLTVWRSDEATSIGCVAISARMWLATTMSAVLPASPVGRA